MAQFGRKIYYELSTGNVIITLGQRMGDVVETTTADDFAMFIALQPYQQSAVGCIELSYGLDDSNFAAGYPYHVDTTQTPAAIVWDTAATDLANAQAQKKAQLTNMYAQTLAQGFTSSATGTSTTYGWSDIDQRHMLQLRDSIKDGLEVFPVTDYADIHGNTITLTDQSQFNQLEVDAKKFSIAQLKQLRSFVGQVMSGTTVDAVNAIQWTPATY